jgi:hypothetical protein
MNQVPSDLLVNVFHQNFYVLVLLVDMVGGRKKMEWEGDRGEEDELCKGVGDGGGGVRGADLCTMYCAGWWPCSTRCGRSGQRPRRFLTLLLRRMRPIALQESARLPLPGMEISLNQRCEPGMILSGFGSYPLIKPGQLNSQIT